MGEELDLELDELEDFDLSEATYQVWAFKLDEDHNVLEDSFLEEFKDPGEAIDHAKTLAKILEETFIEEGQAPYIELVVETVVDFGDYDENVATIFRDVIKLKNL